MRYIQIHGEDFNVINLFWGDKIDVHDSSYNDYRLDYTNGMEKILMSNLSRVRVYVCFLFRASGLLKW